MGIRTYPRYPQPIILHPTSGLNWYLELTNAGVLRAGGTTTDPPTPSSRLKLVDPTGQAGYKIGLNSDPTPTVIATALTSPKDGNYQDLSVWALNGREWNVRVTSGGSLTVTAISTDWPMIEPQSPTSGHPIPSSLQGVFDGGVWRLDVSDGGINTMSGSEYPPLLQAQRIFLRSDDDTVSWQLACTANGTLYTVGPSDVELAPYFEVLLVSPSGYKFPMSVNAAGVLFIDDGLEAIDHANEWPLVMQLRSNILYVVDHRFRAPVPSGRGRGYGRRRG